MAAAVSEWTIIGTNSGNPAGQGLNVPVNAGTAGEVRHECLMWLDATAKIPTNNFDFPITGDFTVVLNGTLNEITADAGNVDVDVEGSLDGTNYIKLQDLVTWNAGGGAQAETVAMGVYDYDSNGRFPFMRLALTPGSDANCTDAANHVKLTVILHNG
tara:strand:- start:9235 stop:9708 length:474 start_codon:yes stop_codon:yes gene_type:complete